MKLLKRIERLVGIANYINAIADRTPKEDIPEGYAGGSLANENILLVTNELLPKQVVDDVYKKEQVDYAIISTKDILETYLIVNALKNLIGPFTHVINVFYDHENLSLFDDEGRYNKKDGMYLFYQWLQQEIEYLVSLNQYASISSLFISGNSIDNLVKKKNVEMCIKGLAESLANHGIICNGIVAGKEHELRELLQASVFLSSRYGQIMTGEVLKLK